MLDDKPIDLQTLVDVEVSRANRWHNGNLEEWSHLEWAGAMAGEAGESANFAKKLKRLVTGVQSINQPGRHFTDYQQLETEIAREAADAFLYAILVIIRCHRNPVEVIRLVFNQKSEEYGFPERI